MLLLKNLAENIIEKLNRENQENQENRENRENVIEKLGRKYNISNAQHLIKNLSSANMIFLFNLFILSHIFNILILAFLSKKIEKINYSMF